MNKEYIGLLDSGLGGLSILKELVTVSPKNNYIYFGDTKNIPYGTKTKEEIFSYTSKILNFFIENNVKNVIIACNTTSALVYEDLKKKFFNQLTIYPLIQSVAKYAQDNLTSNDTLAILATKATVNSKKYEEEIKKINPELNLLSLDCSGFVEIVENNLYNDIESLKLIESKFKIIQQIMPKRIVLGCTHYPYLENIFRQFYDTQYFNPAICLANLLKEKLLKIQDTQGTIKYFVSDNPDKFELNSKIFFDIQKTQLINIDDYQ